MYTSFSCAVGASIVVTKQRMRRPLLRGTEGVVVGYLLNRILQPSMTFYRGHLDNPPCTIIFDQATDSRDVSASQGLHEDIAIPMSTCNTLRQLMSNPWSLEARNLHLRLFAPLPRKQNRQDSEACSICACLVFSQTLHHDSLNLRAAEMRGAPFSVFSESSHCIVSRLPLMWGRVQISNTGRIQNPPADST